MKSLKHLNKYLYKYRYRFLLGIIFVVASNLFSVFPAQAVGRAIDLIKEKLVLYVQQTAVDSTNTLQEELNTSILYFSGLILLFALIRGAFMYLMRQTLIVMSRKVEFDLKNEVFAHYQQLSQAFYKVNNTGDLMSRISEDVSRVRMYIGPAVMYFTNLVVTFLVVIPYMYSVDFWFATLVLLPLPVLSYAIFRVNNTINRKSDAIQAQLSSITGFVQETFSGIRVIKSFAVEKDTKQAFEKELDLYKSKSLSLAKTDATFFPLMTFLTGLSTLITLGVGGWLVLQGNIGVGTIAEFIIYVNLLTWPVTALGYTSSLVQRAAASQERINQFLSVKPDIVSPKNAPYSFEKEIRFEHVTYCYPEKSIPALNNISLVIPKGKTIAVLGTTGSGKTTLVQLLLRVMDCTEGSITIDGIDIKKINATLLKTETGYAPQEVFLFSDSVYNNIAFGLTAEKSPVTNEQMSQAVEMAALSQTIAELPQGLQTIVGERGVSLSGGQKQRVAIARALIKDPQLLVLDDCLSAVDTKTEAEILTHLKSFMKHRTALIISHRVSTVKDADYIMLLDNGSITEEGTHAELLIKNGRYASLYRKQLSEVTSEVELN
ncbi:MAG: ABC transporter ATP-binding protein/permease [Sphingobacteriales bacterium]|nr:ABC transporter ATP-binding protein/permease [Sphingobacteriales bacterium]